ncbi:lymphocyte antigen 6 complex locus protein G5c [Petaurus breviceps papuanus]|uniref:lymphocyte antigen 6 complex locus protein G5c n=1 Tax=Petaurus breviceps papuanus TaxID=3040969 RepID=UPI0036DED40F
MRAIILMGVLLNLALGKRGFSTLFILCLKLIWKWERKVYTRGWARAGQLGYQAPLLLGANLHLNPRRPSLHPKLLRCYRCVLETKELGCVLGSDSCLTAKGGGCLTTIIHNASFSLLRSLMAQKIFQVHACKGWKNCNDIWGSGWNRESNSLPSGSKEEVTIRDCRAKDQLLECSLSLASPVPGLWVSSRCCLEPLCNSPPLSDQTLLQTQDKNTSIILDFLIPITSPKVTTTSSPKNLQPAKLNGPQTKIPNQPFLRALRDH